jgi:integrase
MRKASTPKQAKTRRAARKKTQHGYAEFVKVVNRIGPKRISIADVKAQMSEKTAGAYVDRVSAYEEFCELASSRGFPLQLTVLKAYATFRLCDVSPGMVAFDFGALRSVASFAGNLKLSAPDMSALLMKARKAVGPARPRGLKGIPALLACVPNLTAAQRREYGEFVRLRLQTVDSATVYACRYQAFERFCRAKHLRALPTNGTALAAFIVFRKKSVTPRTIRLDLCAIRLVHEIAGFDDPVTDERMHELITGVTRSQAPGRWYPITADELKRTVASLKDKFIFECRDHCLLLLLFAAGLISRTARLIDRSLITFEPDGSMILPTQDPKRPQIRVRPGNHKSTCPVRATKNWLDVIGRESGPLFPAWDPRGAWTNRPMSVAKIFISVRERCRRVGIAADRLCARSLRQGFMIAASKHANPAQVADYVGLSSVSALEHHTGRLASNNVMDGRKQRAINKRRWAKRIPAGGVG